MTGVGSSSARVGSRTRTCGSDGYNETKRRTPRAGRVGDVTELHPFEIDARPRIPVVAMTASRAARALVGESGGRRCARARRPGSAHGADCECGPQSRRIDEPRRSFGAGGDDALTAFCSGAPPCAGCCRSGRRAAVGRGPRHGHGQVSKPAPTVDVRRDARARSRSTSHSGKRSSKLVEADPSLPCARGPHPGQKWMPVAEREVLADGPGGCPKRSPGRS